MLGTIMEQNGDGLLEDSHMPVGWPLQIDGAVRECYIHRAASLQELDDMLKEYDMKRDSVEINTTRLNGPIMQCGTDGIWNRNQDIHWNNYWGGPFLRACFLLRFEDQKRSPFFVILFCSNFHSLEALGPGSKPASKPAPRCFVLISMVSRHWSSRLALRPASNFVSSHKLFVLLQFP